MYVRSCYKWLKKNIEPRNIFVGAYFFIRNNRSAFSSWLRHCVRPNIVGETTRTHVEGEFRSYPRAKNITYTRDFRVAG